MEIDISLDKITLGQIKLYLCFSDTAHVLKITANETYLLPSAKKKRFPTIFSKRKINKNFEFGAKIKFSQPLDLPRSAKMKVD